MSKIRLAAELAALRQEHDSLTLQFDTAYKALEGISSMTQTTDSAKGTDQVAQMIGIAQKALSGIGNPAELVDNVGKRAQLELGKDTARLDLLDSLAGAGGVGFGYEQIGGSFLQFPQVTESEQQLVDFRASIETARRLLDVALREKRSVWHRWTVYLPEKGNSTWKSR